MKSPYHLFVSDEAYSDILDAFLWYQSLREGLGSDFELCLEAEINRIVSHPLQYQEKYKKIRIAYIERFPYGVHYVIEKNVVKVIAVFHTSQDPINWEERIG